MAAPDNAPGSKIPVGPSSGQPATNPQKTFVDHLGLADQLPADATKGDASQLISKGLADAKAHPGPGAAQDTTAGSKVPTGPSAEQPATRNQKALVESLGATDALPDGATKGEASAIISNEIESGNPGRRQGALPDTLPGSNIPSGPSAQQPATNNQKNLLESLGASAQLPSDATKADASKIISEAQGLERSV